MRKVKQIHQAAYSPIAELITYNVLPGPKNLQLDPFIFLNHHGPQVYPKHNSGLPFGPHPHRGMETVTFIIDGDILHKDSDRHESVITGGGVQWMTAGKGLIHAEVSSLNFKRNGGPLEILQLWLNLPSKLKMTSPSYLGLQKEEIQKSVVSEGVEISLISGIFNGIKASFETLTDVFLSTIQFKKTTSISFDVLEDRNVFLYVVKGNFNINGNDVAGIQLVEFENKEESILIECREEGLIIFGHGKPFGEPIVARGPFVMNSMEEIHQAYTDYQNGLFGSM
ncbi:MAG: pirin family protein [Saprospiraceae bacterium]|nr:pirin family protein [Saprospiraceae bacterium]